MPSKHSKNNTNRGFFTHYEHSIASGGSQVQRLGTDSQLPFGYCSLSLSPAIDPVITPSGHIYSRESIIEYLLLKTRELKEQQKLYESQKLKEEFESKTKSILEKERELESFAENQESIAKIAGSSSKRKVKEIDDLKERGKFIDETEREEDVKKLQLSSPWIPQFTPEAADSKVKEPPKRPPSPFTGQPLRAKDLIPITLERESTSTSETSTGSTNGGGPVRFICPVSRKTLTNQSVVCIKSTGCVLLSSVARDLALPTLLCPVTNKPFKPSDLIELQSATSGFASSGEVQAKKYRPTMT